MLALVIGGVLVLMGVFATVVVRVGLLPLDRMGHTAAAIAGGDLSHRVATTDPRTEVGRLGTALNRMLDRLEDAFAAREASQERLRRFIADASHELRTPLVSIRGYAELYRMGAARSDEDVAKAMRRIEDESARMGVLVEDLLTLARLDEVRPAPHGPVDLAVLASDAVDDARVTAPDREISLDGRPRRRHRRCRPAAPGVREPAAERAGAHARGHADRCVRGGGERHRGAGGARPRSRPAGDDPGALFERFWRAEGGRERGKGGAGLGLAIVAGIVDAHGGTVSAANAPGWRRGVPGALSRPLGGARARERPRTRRRGSAARESAARQRNDRSAGPPTRQLARQSCSVVMRDRVCAHSRACRRSPSDSRDQRRSPLRAALAWLS